MVSVDTERPYDHGCAVVLLESILPIKEPFFNQVTVGCGLPSTSHVRVTVLVSFVVMWLGETSMAGGSEVKEKAVTSLFHLVVVSVRSQLR